MVKDNVGKVEVIKEKKGLGSDNGEATYLIVFLLCGGRGQWGRSFPLMLDDSLLYVFKGLSYWQKMFGR